MKTINTSTWIACLLVVLAGRLASAENPTDAEKPNAKKPNVIFILMDDMGYSDVSCYGATKVNTPNIDRMAAEGLRFTDFHTGASICSPSRAASDGNAVSRSADFK